MNNKVYVAKLGKAVGLKGHLRLFNDSDFPEQFKKGSTYLKNKNLQLTISEYLKDRDLVSFEGFSDMESAKKLTNTELYTTIEQTKEFCKLKDNEFFWFDLILCEVYEDNLKLGVVSDVHRFPLNDYLEVKTDSQLVEKGLPKIFLIPHIFETFIQRVDIENKKIFAINAFDILENS